ncbi:MAG: roadblock/LC7 domain-containing protein [Candidatus Jordarchaeales archaeon]
MSELQPALKGIITTVKRSSPSIHSIFVIDQEGNVSSASDLPPTSSEFPFFSSLLSIAQRIASGFDLGEVNHVFLEGKDKSIILMKATDKSSIVALVESNVFVPQVLVGLKMIASYLESLEESK